MLSRGNTTRQDQIKKDVYDTLVHILKEDLTLGKGTVSKRPLSSVQAETYIKDNKDTLNKVVNAIYTDYEKDNNLNSLDIYNHKVVIEPFYAEYLYDYLPTSNTVNIRVNTSPERKSGTELLVSREEVSTSRSKREVSTTREGITSRPRREVSTTREVSSRTEAPTVRENPLPVRKESPPLERGRGATPARRATPARKESPPPTRRNTLRTVSPERNRNISSEGSPVRRGVVLTRRENFTKEENPLREEKFSSRNKEISPILTRRENPSLVRNRDVSPTKTPQKAAPKEELVLDFTARKSSDTFTLEEFESNTNTFYDFLLKELKNQTVTLVKPDFISCTNDDYFKALNLYVNAFTRNSQVDLLNLSEKDIYFLAVVAYIYDDLAPLRILNNQLKTLTDKYYWLYLAEEDNLFRPTMEIEMYIRGTSTKAPQVLSLDNTQLSYEDYGKWSILPNKGSNFRPVVFDDGKKRLFPIDFEYTPKIMETGHHYDWGFNMFVNAHAGIPNTILDNYNPRLKTILDTILKLGGVIAGGFVNSLLNPAYARIALYKKIINFNFKTGRNHLKFLKFYRKKLEPRRGQQSHFIEEDNDSYIKHSDIPDFYECVKMYNAKKYFLEKASRNFSKKYEDTSKTSKDTSKPFLENPPDYDILFSEYQRKRKDYDLNAKLEQLKYHLLPMKWGFEEELYQLVYQFSHDVDIFVTGDDYLEKSNKIIQYLLNLSDDCMSNVVMGEYVTTFSFGKALPHFQIIKKGYRNIQEVLCSSDLDSSRAALYLEGGQQKYVFLESYVNAVKYGLNLVVPNRQSKTYNYRLAKYYNRGFQVYFPGNIAKRFGMLDWENIPKLEDWKIFGEKSRNRYTDRKKERKEIEVTVYDSDEEEERYLKRSEEKALEKEKQRLKDLEVGTRISSYRYTAKEFFIFRDVKHKWTDKPPSDYEPRYEIKEKLSSLEEKANLYYKNKEEKFFTGELMPEMEDIIIIANKILIHMIRRTYKSPNTLTKVIETRKELIKALVEYMSSLFWRTTNFGLHFTSSFNPTNTDYLKGENIGESGMSFDSEMMLVKEVVENHLPSALAVEVAQYRGRNLEVVFANLKKLESFFEKKYFDLELGNKLLVEFQGGKVVEQSEIPRVVVKEKQKPTGRSRRQEETNIPEPQSELL
jgi:hypothetical protein